MFDRIVRTFNAVYGAAFLATLLCFAVKLGVAVGNVILSAIRAK